MAYARECFNDLKSPVKFAHVYVWRTISVISSHYSRLYVDLALVCDLCFKFICYYMYISVSTLGERGLWAVLFGQ